MNTVVSRPARTRSWFAPATAAVLPVVAAAALGALATLPNIPTWYEALRKPPLTPPDAVFGSAWTVLYAMMAYAVWRILRMPPGVKGRGRAIGWFFVQLALNAMWSCAFFALGSPAAGAVDIVALVLALAVTIRMFSHLDRTAGLLLVPYLAWVSFAAYLNLAIRQLNP